MFFICDYYHYVFSAEAFPYRCPDCGELDVRLATEEERAEQPRLLMVVAAENWDDAAERGA